MLYKAQAVRHRQPALSGGWRLEFRFAGLAALTAGAVLIAGAALAQGGFSTEPANLPPEDYPGNAFVDDTGCVFVRARFDGMVTWVPRVTRLRDPVCGQTPTFAVAKPDVPAVEEPLSPGIAAIPEPVPETVPEPVIVAAPPAQKPAPALRDPIPSQPVATQDVILPPGADRSAALPAIPEGFRAAWTDDRLNPRRGWQSPDGVEATGQVWTNTVPRVLIGSAGALPPRPAVERQDDQRDDNSGSDSATEATNGR
jgi:hypothetical protein